MVLEKKDKRDYYVMLSNYDASLVKEFYKNYNFNYIKVQRNIEAKDKGIV